jgi:hypothetical protein
MRLIVGDARGLDSGEYSFPYVTRWAADGSTEVVKETADRAIGCAKEILVALEGSWPLRRQPRNGGGCRYRHDLEADRRSPSGWLLIKVVGRSPSTPATDDFVLLNRVAGTSPLPCWPVPWDPRLD